MAGTHRHLIWFIFAVLLWNTAPQTAYGWSLFGPKTYNECVLEKIKDANNTAAVIAVKQSCRELYPIKKVVLSSRAIKNVTASDTESTYFGFNITIKNDNNDWTVTNFQIAFSETDGKVGTVIPASTPPPEGTICVVFEIEEAIAPYGKSVIFVQQDPDKSYNLWLTGVKGYQ